MRIISSASVIGASWNSRSKFCFNSFSNNRNNKEIITRNKKKKHEKILMLAKSKLNSIEILVSQSLIDMEISHKEFIAIMKEKDKYDKIKENLKNISKNMRLKIM